jgi:uncharacterized surface protein with fasciclin (FAS1) repeats
MKTIQAILTLDLLLAGANIFGQAQFKNSDEAAFKMIKAEEVHKMESIEKLVQATRTFEDLDPKKEYTIFAPNNKAFKRLSVQTIDYLINPEHANELNDLLSYHTLDGSYSEKQIKAQIKKGEGKAYFTTLAGFSIMAYLDKEETVILVDQNNRKMRIVEPNYAKGDHVVHVIDGMILPHSAVY